MLGLGFRGLGLPENVFLLNTEESFSKQKST